MTNRNVIFATATLVAVALVSEAAMGQAPALPRNFGRPKSPSISPNLLLLNRNNSFDYNYLSTMGINNRMNQMQQQYGRELDQIERDFYSNRLQTPAPRSTAAPMTSSTTGHPTGFFNYGAYYRLGTR